MDDWEKFNETSLPEEYFYGNLKTEDIDDTNYVYTKIDCKNFQIESLGEYHDL